MQEFKNISLDSWGVGAVHDMVKVTEILESAYLLKKQETLYLILYPPFEQEFNSREVFPVSLRDTEDQQLLLKQRKLSAADYALKFFILTVKETSRMKQH